MTDWQARFLDLADHVAGWSKDRRKKVGAVLVIDRRVVGMGYNGLPRGVVDSPERLHDKELKLKLTAHAEVNAIHNAIIRPQGATLYVTHAPCNECAKHIIQSGVVEVVCPHVPPDAKTSWREAIELARLMFSEAGVIYTEINR